MNNPTLQYCSGPVTRRSFLTVGALGLGGLGLSDLLRLQAEASTKTIPEQDTAVIFVWLPGGPPHMEMYDMKPDAPADYRGDFRPIRTNVSGLDVCELMPLHAKLAHKYNIIRSIAHKFADHGGGHKRFLTGREPKTPTGFVNDAPMVGSLVAKMREHRNIGIPNYIVNAPNGRHNIDVFSFGSAYIGPESHPFIVPGDPGAKGFQVKNISLSPKMADRLDDRVTLLKGFDRLRKEADNSGAMEALDEFNRRAVNLLTGNRMRDAFDLTQEDPKLRDRYGRHAWGQRALLSRRLVEAGASFVTIVMENPYKSGVKSLKEGVYNWDSHAVNCHIYKDARVRLPIYDRAVTALVEDICNRGLDKR
ncbi:MAG: DUF1501 domain-containing protein, partial [Planctomycetes bacterium]|nr:DUF1501 domain-containing protein [Planctomycetota bacterium]